MLLVSLCTISVDVYPYSATLRDRSDAASPTCPFLALPFEVPFNRAVSLQSMACCCYRRAHFEVRLSAWMRDVGIRALHGCIRVFLCFPFIAELSVAATFLALLALLDINALTYLRPRVLYCC